ncbi:uncharacterized protein LOC122043927 [Zingiber officinale]|uniref:uncharacterized protein LOC122043927 n=1 Tax=Zingiber officinale TaxID=94328 RepID=UPI001C4B8355|nr:uncharacterized protein LOC122043927 [Zingiber officinale]
MLERLKDYRAPKSVKELGPIVFPEITVKSFMLRPSFVSKVQENQFGGSESENPYLHLLDFHSYCNTLRVEGVMAESIQLIAFPFSLRNNAKNKNLLDAVAGGSLMEKSLDEAREIIHTVVSNLSEWSGQDVLKLSLHPIEPKEKREH